MARGLDTANYKKMLLDEKDRLELEHRVQMEDVANSGQELADYDNHPADSATDTFERAKDYAIDENIEEIIERIDEALRKIEDGTYGICDRCERDIHPDRLRAIPYATLCIDCQEATERR